MKKNLVLLTSFLLLAAGCQSWRAEQKESGYSSEQAGIMNGRANDQSVSSDPNQASFSRNVGQSGNVDETTGTAIPEAAGGFRSTTNHNVAPVETP